MSDAYEINGVKVTPIGGGFYELTHPKLPEAVKERGKENADARAKAIAASLQPADPEGSMENQPSLEEVLTAPTAPVAPAAPVADSDEVAKLKAQLASEQKARQDAEEAKAKLEQQIETKTVVTDGGEAPVKDRIPAQVPRKFEGPMDDKAKAQLKKLGVEVTDIILEENENIPPTGLFIGHNGRGYVIVPGEEVTVPNFLLGVLDDAIMSTPVQDSKNQKVLGYRNRSRYPYRRV